MGQILAITDSPEHAGRMAVWHERIPSITPGMSQLDPEDPLHADEGMMDGDMTPLVVLQQNVYTELRSATQVHYAPQTKTLYFRKMLRCVARRETWEIQFGVIRNKRDSARLILRRLRALTHYVARVRG